MWFLKSQKDGTIYYIRPDIPKHIVSRSTGNLIIANDPSISRNHAFLLPESDDALKLVDAGSRYGTFVNVEGDGEGAEIPKDAPVRLSPGDRVRFGKCDSRWEVERIEFRCISSTISVTDGLVRVLRKLGGVLEEAFVEGRTRYLVMKTITTTPKLLMSLIGQIPVVTPEYFEECLKAVERGQELPDVEGFIPEFTEAYVRREGISFRKVPGREKLFEGMTFIFIKPKHMAQYEGIVKMAGGKCVCAQKRKIAKSYFTQDKVVVIQVTMDSLSQGTSQAIDGLTQIVNNAGRRLIPEAEIGLAILHCSLEKYCNPLYKFSNVLDLETVPFEAHGDTLARNTEELPSSSKRGGKVVESISIPETESHDNLPGTLQSTNFSDAELKISEVESEFAKANENETTGRSKRKRTEPAEAPKEVKRLRSKPVEEEPQLEIPETPEEPPPAPSQPADFSGFLSVNHEEAPPEQTTTTTKSAQKPKRPLQLMLDDDGEDDLFNFAEAAPKRAKRQPTLAESFSSSSQRRSQLDPEPPTGAPDDLFAFGNESSRRAKKRNSESTPKPDESGKNGATNAPPSSYKQFIKPIQIPADGWLSSTFCELKIKAGDADGEVRVKIKEEPEEEDQKTRVWIDGMQSMFQVRVKCMNLTSHHQRTRDETASERSFFSTAGQGSAGGKNFKAFVKKHNYKPQQTIVKTMPVCVLDNTQDDHF